MQQNGQFKMAVFGPMCLEVEVQGNVPKLAVPHPTPQRTPPHPTPQRAPPHPTPLTSCLSPSLTLPFLVQRYLAHNKCLPLHDHHRALGIGLL